MSPLASFTATSETTAALIDGSVILRLIHHRGKGQQMKPVRVVGVCLLAVIAFGAVTATTASATAPEFGQCLKKAEDSLPGYKDSKCTKAATELKAGNYEWLPGAVAGKRRFTITGGALSSYSGGKTITCTSEQGEGEYSLTSSKQLSNVVIAFTGCKLGPEECRTTGANPHEIVTNQLAGDVGYENLSAHTTALKLAPGPMAAGSFMSFHCGVAPIDVRGREGIAGAGILVNIKNDKMTSTETLKYKGNSTSVQSPAKWEGEPTETYLELSYFELGYLPYSMTMTVTLTNDEEMKYELSELL